MCKIAQLSPDLENISASHFVHKTELTWLLWTQKKYRNMPGPGRTLEIQVFAAPAAVRDGLWEGKTTAITNRNVPLADTVTVSSFSSSADSKFPGLYFLALHCIAFVPLSHAAPFFMSGTTWSSLVSPALRTICLHGWGALSCPYNWQKKLFQEEQPFSQPVAFNVSTFSGFEQLLPKRKKPS